ncbi:hypothetical protein AVEN_207713-1 [Araneus ventricosus]|uniref:Uncharacterized protein n=1 Tax=Araneus ventricosus TaxID=182803 RepID=A0A4Y2PD64_ARAVE|nr:hypothetical protein AVEN_207713-1 [Araneus ventricosus]
MTMGDTYLNEPSFKLSKKNLAFALFSFAGEFDGHASPSGTIFREPIEKKLSSSRYAPAHHGALQGKAVAGSGYIQPRYLTLEVVPEYSITATATLTLQQQVLVPKEQTTSRLTGAG